MTENDQPHTQAPLNPTLSRRSETTHDLSTSPAPVDTASAHEGAGEGWPIAWLLLAALIRDDVVAGEDQSLAAAGG